MAFRRVPVALCIALAIALGSAGAVGASRPSASATSPRAATNLRAAATTIRKLASTAGAGGPTAAAIVPFSLCWQRDYTDPAGDAPIDAIAYRLTYDCQTSTWRLSVTLTHAVDAATFDSLASEIDTDNNPSNGCDGFDLLVAGVFDSHGAPKGVLVATPTCDSSTWTTVSPAGFAASGTALALTYSETALGNAPRLIWNAGVVPKTQTDPVDELPDQGVLVADKFLPSTNAHDGYWLVDAAGGVHAYGNAGFHGDLSGAHLAQPVVGMTRKPDRAGYWLLGRDGGVFTFGAASFYGSTGHLHLQQPVVGMASTRAGHGYWFVAADGGIFSFGDARFWGSTGALHLNEPIVGMAPTKTGKGYWLVASDGGIFSFGDARFHGSTGALHLQSPIVGMTTSPTGSGYRFVASDGGIFSFGDAEFLGGLGGGRPPSPIVGMG
ncbi:MAG TPA: hypothetical protein VIK61_01290 [Acidimicrobiia bacterium]